MVENAHYMSGIAYITRSGIAILQSFEISCYNFIGMIFL